MRALFIADAHLRRPEDDNYRRMLQFLSDLPGQPELLVIAGDFFEFWLGDSPDPFPHYKPLLDALAGVTARGVKLVFIEGNHDFHLGGYFRKTFHAEVFPESTTVTLDGKRFYVCHGDRINRKDYGYMALRFTFRNILTRQLARILPSSVPAWIALRLGKHSKSNHRATAVKWDTRQLVRNFAEKRFAAGDDVVVTAHYHNPFIESHNGKFLLALGDWITQFSYGEWLDGELTLKCYPGKGVTP
jgi:UDP-2,3-diacylglucosamine hydrolase